MTFFPALIRETLNTNTTCTIIIIEGSQLANFVNSITRNEVIKCLLQENIPFGKKRSSVPLFSLEKKGMLWMPYAGEQKKLLLYKIMASLNHN